MRTVFGLLLFILGALILLFAGSCVLQVKSVQSALFAIIPAAIGLILVLGGAGMMKHGLKGTDPRE